MKNQLTQVLNDIIASALKRSDAPASSETHEHSAIVTLLELCPEWQPWDDESRQLVEFAKEHMAHYTHAGDCTIYRALINGDPEDGICTCGYGWKLARKGDRSQMYSEEKINVAKSAGQQ